MNNKIIKTMFAFIFATLLLFGCANKEEPVPPTNEVPPANDTIEDENLNRSDEVPGKLPDENIDNDDQDGLPDDEMDEEVPREDKR